MKPLLRRPAVLAVAVFVLCVLAHLPVWWQYRADPYSSTLVSDAFSYDQWADQILQHGLGAEPVFHQAPLFPVLLSWIFRAAPEGERWHAAIGFQVLLTSLAIALLVPMGRLYLRSAAAGAAGAIVALMHGPFVFHSFKLLPVALALATLAAALVALGIAREKASSGPAALAGVLLGVAALARSEMLLYAPVAALSVAFPLPQREPRARLKLVLAFLGGLVLGVAPATVHNLRQGDTVLIASSGGENLYIGNKRGAQGDYTPLHPKAGDLFSERILAREVAEKAAGHVLRPSEVSVYWRAKAMEEVLADPMGWLRLEVKKLGRVIHPGDPNDIYSFPLERSLYLPALHALMLPAWFLLAAGSAGIVLALPRRKEAWTLAMLPVVQLAVLMIFFVNTRLRLPMLYSLAPFGGFALEECARLFQEGKRRVPAGAAVLALAVIAVSGALLTRAEPRDLVRLASVLSSRDRLDEGLRVLEPALSGPFPYALALDQAGWLLQKKGDLKAARDRYREALAAGVPEGRAAQTRTRLAMVLERLGDTVGAAAAHDAAVADPSATAGTFYERGMFRLRRGDRVGALRDMEEAMGRDPSWEAPRSALAGIRGG